MKFIKEFTYILVCMMCSLSACTSENFDNMQESGSNLKISVSDGGYVSAEPLQGRTATDGYNTTFTDGDVIGIFTVVNGVVTQENMGMMYNSDTKNWFGLLKKETNPDAKYFAYYPWRKDLKGEVNPNASTAEDFFKEVVDAWELPKDQRTYKKYTSIDLMIAQGNITEESGLNFTMQHCMGLVIIQLPMTKYEFQNTDPQLADYLVPPPGIAFDNFDPCMMFGGTYRYLIKPNVNTPFSGSYIKERQEHTFSAEPNLSSGRYKKYNVDGGSITTIEHTLQVGDYYMKDGSLVSKNTTLTAEQKDQCLGIVFWTGNPTETDLTLKSYFPNCRHGLICSVRDGENVSWQYNNNLHVQTVQDWVAANSTEFMNIATGGKAEDNLNRIQGYNNTKAMEFFNSSEENSRYKLEIALYLQSFREAYPTPSFTSGWYIPSAKELFIMFNDAETEDIFHCIFPSGENYELLSKQFTQLGEYADHFNSKQENAMKNMYHSSSENNVYRVWCVDSERYGTSDSYFYITVPTKHDKAYKYHTRFVLAF
ncbi:fimbrillin family protein [Phocaeicola sp. HCN-40430]|uniref:fimbrillin family protein n=1 Tax=Phocaeicola sp. HCN-40430 TaxID=3134664 RepID=UPI0030C294D6